MDTRTEIIVVGGGHNGLTAAALLAKAGRKVLLLERRDILGGMAARENFHPGFAAPGLLHDTESVRRGVVHSLGLEGHGLRWRQERLPVFVPQKNGKGLLLSPSADRARNEIVPFSSRDADAYRQWRDLLGRLRGFWKRVVDEPAPVLGASSPADFWVLAQKAMALRGLGEKDMIEVLRIGPMCVADWLNERFETPILKAALAGPAIEGTWLGPWSPGTVVTLLLRELSAGPEVQGGPAALIEALVASARQQGVDIRTGCPVREILMEKGRVEGVATENGDTFHASQVVSSCDPRRTFLEWISPQALPHQLEAAIQVWRSRGTTAAVRLALQGKLRFAGRDGEDFEVIRTGEHLDHLEQAFDAVKYGECSPEPHLEIRVPSLSDPTLAPENHQVVSILVHFAPYHLRAGWNDAEKEKLFRKVIRTLARYAPAVEEQIVGREVLTPMDLEQRYGLTGGQIHHGESGIDQCFTLRPTPSCSGHTTPIPGLFLCGSGSHPGGGITCAPGGLAAAALLSS